MAELSNNNQEEDVLDLREIWNVIMRGKWYIITSFVLVVGMTVFLSLTADPVYQSSAKVMLQQNKLSQGSFSFIENYIRGRSLNALQNRLRIIESESVMREAKKILEDSEEFARVRNRNTSNGSFIAKAFGGGQEDQAADPITVGELKGMVDASVIPETDIIKINVKGETPRGTQMVANAVVESFRKQEKETSREDLGEVESFLNEQLGKMEERLKDSEKNALQFQEKHELMLGESGVKNKLTRLEEMKAEAEVTLADKEDKLESINKMLATVKQDLFEEQFTDEGQRVLTELQDKYIQVKKIRNDIQELEEERSEYLEQENYAKVRELEGKIKQKRKTYQEAATEEFSVLGTLPRYEKLITSQLEAKMEVEAAKNRVQVLDEKIKNAVNKYANYGLQLLRIKRNLDINKEMYTLLRKNYEQTRIAEAGELGGVRVVSQGNKPIAPIKPNKKRNIMLGVVLGLAVGVGLAFVREYLDTSVRTPDEVENLGLTNLGIVNNIEKEETGERIEEIRKTLVTNFGPKSRIVDSYTTLEANLRFLSVDEPLESILITSSIPGEGKTTTTINLGMTFAQMGKDTLIVDTDLRKHAFAEIFDLPPEPGLMQVALDEIDSNKAIKRPIIGEGYPIGIEVKELLLERDMISESEYERALTEYKQNLKTGEAMRKSLIDILDENGLIGRKELMEILIENSKGQENLYVLPAGGSPPNTSAFLNSDSFEDIVENLKQRFDMILFDSSPVTSTPDPSILSAIADGTVLLIDAEGTSSDKVTAAMKQLNRTGGQLLGAVLNKVHEPKSRYYGYDYYYGYETEE